MFPPDLQFYALPIDDQRLHGEVHPNGGALLLDIGAVFEALDNTGNGENESWYNLDKKLPSLADAHVADQHHLMLGKSI